MNAAAPRAFVVGWPIAHSRSPIIHNYWLHQLGLAGRYEAVAVAPPDFADFAQNLAARGFVGGNVTLPHKQNAFGLVAEATHSARRLEAVNTLWIEDGRLYGDNTDSEGFLCALDEAAPGWEAIPGEAVVLGAGGAARAIVAALIDRGRSVVLANRTRARAEAIAAHFGDAPKVIDWRDLPAALKTAGLLVNTTSLGMKGQPPLDLDVALLPQDAVVHDIVYFPLETALLRAARARGLRVAPGLGMLLHQAAPAFARWFATRPKVTPELRRLVEADIEKAL
ncbi:shikimate 5-dehydrogenase [Methylocella silvestris BL2]|uniref:Shikimate dehydrogenase (NADP(+)) n=1 Tax=Methylocella silvestris (strain DSM 15510 / CIP 108128 / LMG 27833 / NCIMB 13906 / BL2) TaxID=395965 RepID=AROE_METSB|nr:shikimate dehydrogenase [Methylocella silvestris]B8EM72.1 RecName: Full=Shikimate dehydrogenase (NADP(+)); Short=SDH [Methylocella silvestris BL2]ACK51461.1 shikimate 5-dehydrogenase [Methylocella silvestris BL2]